MKLFEVLEFDLDGADVRFVPNGLVVEVAFEVDGSRILLHEVRRPAKTSIGSLPGRNLLPEMCESRLSALYEALDEALTDYRAGEADWLYETYREAM